MLPGHAVVAGCERNMRAQKGDKVLREDRTIVRVQRARTTQGCDIGHLRASSWPSVSGPFALHPSTPSAAPATTLHWLLLHLLTACEELMHQHDLGSARLFGDMWLHTCFVFHACLTHVCLTNASCACLSQSCLFVCVHMLQVV